jgi:CDP-glucose 4,6-dehydratase
MNLKNFNHLKSLDGPVLVTGHTGFKGTWLTYLLESMQIPCFGASLPPKSDSMYSRLNRSGKIPEILLDIRNRSEVTNLILKVKPSVIIHMAAQPLVLESYSNPIETFETNVMGTANILEAAREINSVRVAAVVTTDKVYLNDNSGQAFTENSPLGGKDPYSASKVGTEQAVAAWNKLIPKNETRKVFSLRAGNVIGGGDFAQNRLLPDLIRGLLNQTPVHIRNAGSTRPWQHVLDPLFGYLLAIEAALGGEVFESLNFGPEERALSVREVVEIFQFNSNMPSCIFESRETQSQESKYLELDSSAAREILKWKPYFNQTESIRETLSWWTAGDTSEVLTKHTMNSVELFLSKVVPTL